MAVLGPHEFGLRIGWGAQGGSQISTGREVIPGGSAVLLTPSEGLEIEHSDFDAENIMLKGDDLRQVVEIVIGGLPTVLEVRFMWLCMSLGRILSQGYISTNLIDSMRHQVDLRKVDVGIQLLGNIYLVAVSIPPGIHFMLLLGWLPSFSICFRVYLSLYHEFCCQGIGFRLHLFGGLREKENIFEGVKKVQGILHAAQSCIIVRFISRIHIAFEQCLCALNCVIEYRTLSGASAS